MASACSESLGTVRKNNPLSGKSSSDIADAVGEHVSTPAWVAVESDERTFSEEVGPMIASTPLRIRSCTASIAAAGVSPSSSTMTFTFWPSTPPTLLISFWANWIAARIDAPIAGAEPPRGNTAPTSSA